MRADPRPPDHPEGRVEDVIERLVELLSRLPGLGPRSARRAALVLLDRRDSLLSPLAAAMMRSAEQVQHCNACGNYSTGNFCRICQDPERSDSSICVVESVADLWAMERAGVFRGRYHVLGGTLTAIGNVRPEDLRIPALLNRVRENGGEVILALNATFDGQTTAHYIAGRITDGRVKVTRIGFGVPVGGELDYLDGETLAAAFEGRMRA